MNIIPILVMAGCQFSIIAQTLQPAEPKINSLLFSPITIAQSIPKDKYIFEEAQIFASASSVPISIELLTNHEQDPVRKLEHSVSAGHYTVQSALRDIRNQGSYVTWKIVDGSIFIIIRTNAELYDPLDTKVTKSYDNTQSLASWVNWLYEQSPVTGLELTSPDLAHDFNKVHCHVKSGSTFRTVFATLSEQTSGVWYFRIEKNNYIVSHIKPLPPLKVPPLTDSDIRYLNKPAVGDQLGRTEVYYYSR